MKRVNPRRIKGKLKAFFSLSSLFLFFSLLVYACASQGMPQGGDFDLDPPVFVRSKPAPNAVNFRGNKIELIFDEYISIEKPGESVIITPPQLTSPVIKAIGKGISVELKDTLILNATYTFDFTNGIVDNNEKNAMEGFTFAFSTGDVIDSLVISGVLLNAANLEPMPGIIVGLHSNLSDTAFTHLPFDRTSRTNDRGQFWIRNIAPGSYRLFALGDNDRNFRYNFPLEGIAFEDSLIVPSFTPALRMDTLWRDTLTIDTIREVHYTRFLPDNLLLYYFQDNFITQYLSKTERPTDRQLIFRFSAPVDISPYLYLIGDSLRQDWYIPEYSPDRSTLTCWLTDSLVFKNDTLLVGAEYMAHDSLFNLTLVSDTIRMNFRSRREEKKKKDDKNKEGEKPNFLDIRLTPGGTADILDTVKILFGEPLRELYPSDVRVERRVDTLWEAREFPLLQDSLNPRLIYLTNQWGYGEEYRVIFDSAKVHSIYDRWNDSIAFGFKFRNEDEYGDLYVKIVGNVTDGFGELLDASDKVVRHSSLYNGELIFENLKPGKYYLRYIEDQNGNGKWDPGRYSEWLQPEKVYYYNSFFEVKKIVGIEQTWDIHSIPLTRQKPLEITKNKPVEKKSKRDELEREQNQQRNKSSSSSIGGASRAASGIQSMQRNIQ